MAAPSQNSFTWLVARVFWIMIGPALLLLIAGDIVTQGNGWFTTADFLFIGVLACMVVARWLEFQRGDPQTATGEPATWGNLRRYAAAALSLGLGVWVVANLIGNRVLTG